jgi:hypothetical protein
MPTPPAQIKTARGACGPEKLGLLASFSCFFKRMDSWPPTRKVGRSF